MKFTLSFVAQLALCASALAAPAPQASSAPTPPNANIPASTTVDLTGQKVIQAFQNAFHSIMIADYIVA